MNDLTQIVCDECEGTKVVSSAPLCPACDGKGVVSGVLRHVPHACPRCGGKGVVDGPVEGRPCRKCGGYGWLWRCSSEDS